MGTQANENGDMEMEITAFKLEAKLRCSQLSENGFSPSQKELKELAHDMTDPALIYCLMNLYHVMGNSKSCTYV